MRWPTLRYTHPNFFMIYAATFLFHLSLGVIMVSTGPEYWTSPTLKHVHEFAPHYVWGMGNLLIALGLGLGVYNRNNFNLSRLTLAVAVGWCAARLFLIAITIFEGDASSLSGISVWGLVTALHLSQCAEPPSNPRTGTHV